MSDPLARQRLALKALEKVLIHTLNMLDCVSVVTITLNSFNHEGQLAIELLAENVLTRGAPLELADSRQPSSPSSPGNSSSDRTPAPPRLRQRANTLPQQLRLACQHRAADNHNRAKQHLANVAVHLSGLDTRGADLADPETRNDVGRRGPIIPFLQAFIEAEDARIQEGEERRRAAAEAARRVEEERRRAEEARRAEEEKRRAEAARRTEEEKRRAEAARRAEEEKRRAEEAARQAQRRQPPQKPPGSGTASGGKRGGQQPGQTRRRPPRTNVHRPDGHGGGPNGRPKRS